MLLYILSKVFMLRLITLILYKYINLIQKIVGEHGKYE